MSKFNLSSCPRILSVGWTDVWEVSVFVENQISDHTLDFWILEIYKGDYIYFFQEFCQY